jgi:PAS domain S-box-containing protein
VAFAICDPGLSFGAIVSVGAKERAAELGVNLSIVSVFTPREHAAVIERFIAEAVDVLIVEAVESEVVVPAIHKAHAAGIPVIVADMRIHGVETACEVRSDNVKGGELAAGYLVDRLQGEGLIAHLQGLLTSDNGVDRSRGFHNVVDGHPGIRIVDTSSEWTTEAGAAAMRELLARHPSVQAVFANNDPLALGALAAIEEAGRTGEIVVAGFDALPGALVAIERGAMAATIRQMPRSMGRVAVELALRIYSGERVPALVETDVALVTAEGVAEVSLATLPLLPRILLDLTESAAALAEERTLLRTLIDNLPDHIYVKDADSRFVLVNTAGLRHFGAASQEDVVGRTDFEFFPAELASRYFADEQAMIKSGQPLIDHEERSTDSAGNAHWMSTTKVVVRDSSGSIVGLVGMNRDITARKQAEAEQARLATEQAALRRVATLVAEAATAQELFSAVATEVARVLDVAAAVLVRYEPDGTAITLAASHDPDWAAVKPVLHVGNRWPPDPGSLTATVHETGRATRIDDHSALAGAIGETLSAAGIGSGCSAPIIVDGNLWGAIGVFSRQGALLAADTEARLRGFTELVATAVSNAEAQAELVASRARVVTAGDEARRRVVRDLHDGAQQRLVHTILTLELSKRAQESDDETANALLDEALDHAQQANEELRDLAHGILPEVLARGGLAAGVDALVSHLRVPVRLDLPDERFTPAIEASVYFIVAEALTNVAKHARAQNARVTAWVEDSVLHVDVRDDGVGGARPDGSGLLGLHDRVATLGGQLWIESAPGRGTRIAAALPL